MVSGEFDQKMFNNSISQAQKQGFIHEAALACEMAGRLIRSSDVDKSMRYMTEACNLYDSWGATGKVSTHKSDSKTDHQIKTKTKTKIE